MNNRFIRIISPLTTGVFACLDAAVVYFGFQAVSRIKTQVSPLTIFLAAVEVAAIIIAVLVTKEIFSNGIRFLDDEIEFTGVDDHNIIEYDKIKSVKITKDNAASLVKNFNDRHTIVFFTFNDDDTLAIDLGLTTNKQVKEIAAEFSRRLKDVDITCEIKNKPDFKNKDKSAD